MTTFTKKITVRVRRQWHELSMLSRHFFHIVSNIRPLVWILTYIGLIPLFAVIYTLLPAGQFRMPDGAPEGYASWLYYSVVTISTLGFGDFTPAGWAAQCVTAVEVLCGLAVFGFFLNAVSSMKGYREPTTRLEKRRRRSANIRRRTLPKRTTRTATFPH